MRQQVLSRPVRTGLGMMVSGLVLAACQSGPPVTLYASAMPDTPVEPVSVPLDPAAIDNRTNEWGGIVPDALPTVPVDDGGLGEVE